MSDYDEITVFEAQRLIDEANPFIIDAKEAFDYRNDHIEGAMQGHGDLIQHLIKTADFERPILVYCYRGTSSKELAEVFGRAGFQQSLSLIGGYTAWKKKDYLFCPRPYPQEVNQWLSFQGFENQALNVTITNQTTPLMIACRDGRLDIASVLIGAGADLNLVNEDGNNALWLACYSGNQALIDVLIDKGININQQNKEGSTALIYAASAGKLAIVEKLVDTGADLQLATKDGFKAIDTASTKEILWLLKLAKENSKTEKSI